MIIQPRAVIIWGCGGHAREVALVCRQAGIDVVGFLDERPHMKGVDVDGVEVLGDLNDVLPLVRREWSFFPGGVGDPKLKRKFAQRTCAAGLPISEPIVHPGADLGEAILEEGVFVGNGVMMTVSVQVGAHVCINRAANLSHDVEVGSFATIAPGAHLSGNVKVGPGANIGVAASVRERTSIGEGAVVGGGSFVAHDVPAFGVVGGVPARPLARARPSGWQ